MSRTETLAIVVAILCCAGGVEAELLINTSAINNPGNAGELSGEAVGGYGPTRICGRVNHAYEIATYEVTAGQYTQFLNAVAQNDTYNLYNAYMWDDPFGDLGCRIERTGSPGDYTYQVDPAWADRPVNYVSWGDAARFANWMNNGQPTGPQGAGTTETGTYTLNGATGVDLVGITRQPDAIWSLPTEDEWYKAAYHQNDGPTGNYYDYPTASDTTPTNVLDTPDQGNNANFFDYFSTGTGSYTLGPPYYTTPVGDFENSASPYGTFDMGGNLWEWHEGTIGNDRGLRGGSWVDSIDCLNAAHRFYDSPWAENATYGFRLVKVPEPTALAAFAVGLLALRRRL